ncbi:hypothetical protein HZA56_09325 [Candidatus Poribacteria bacterium]|nr:hypothetical protein [Candidatus Poribacteria bacterium]
MNNPFLSFPRRRESIHEQGVTQIYSVKSRQELKKMQWIVRIARIWGKEEEKEETFLATDGPRMAIDLGKEREEAISTAD